jgi:hypothetical protein
MKVERELLLRDNVFGYIDIYVLEKMHVIVNVFEFNTFQIICTYDKDKIKESIQCILEKLWIIYGHYQANFIDTIEDIEENTKENADLSGYEITCNGYITDDYVFEFDDFENCKSNKSNYMFIEDYCCIRREYYLTHKNIIDHTYSESIDIYISSDMLKVIHNKHDNTLISNIKIESYFELDKMIECIFTTLQSSYIHKTMINRYYNYNSQNLKYLLSCKLKLPTFDTSKCEYNGYIIKNDKEYIFIKKLKNAI